MDPSALMRKLAGNLITGALTLLTLEVPPNGKAWAIMALTAISGAFGFQAYADGKRARVARRDKEIRKIFEDQEK